MDPARKNEENVVKTIIFAVVVVLILACGRAVNISDSDHRANVESNNEYDRESEAIQRYIDAQNY